MLHLVPRAAGCARTGGDMVQPSDNGSRVPECHPTLARHFDELFAAELERIARVRENKAARYGPDRDTTGTAGREGGAPRGPPRAGLALSGGCIRSAAFGLGVLQALANEGLLKRFDYLSTVSGGGYIGSALTWFLSEVWRRPLVPPRGVPPPRREPVRHRRGRPPARARRHRRQDRDRERPHRPHPRLRQLPAPDPRAVDRLRRGARAAEHGLRGHALVLPPGVPIPGLGPLRLARPVRRGPARSRPGPEPRLALARDRARHPLGAAARRLAAPGPAPVLRHGPAARSRRLPEPARAPELARQVAGPRVRLRARRRPSGARPLGAEVRHRRPDPRRLGGDPLDGDGLRRLPAGPQGGGAPRRGGPAGGRAARGRRGASRVAG